MEVQAEIPVASYEMQAQNVRGPTQTAKTQLEENGWSSRPWLARVIKLILFLGPLVLSLLFSFWAARRFPPTELGLNRWVWWSGLLVCSMAITRWLEILFVRFTPLTTLFQLSLVFPDQAPSRFSVALRSGSVRSVQRRLEDIEASGRAFSDDESYSQQMLDLIRLLSDHDRMTRGHAERVRAYSELIGEELGFDGDELSKLRWGALLHDIGKLDVPAEILNKPGRPDDYEWKILQQHPAAARRYLVPLSTWLGDWVHAADGHHERWDGGGYPDGLAGEEIPLPARIVAVADAFDVMTSTRSYKQAMSLELGRQEVADKAGSQFDPEISRAFLKVSLGDIRRAAGPLAWFTALPGIQQIPLAAAGQQVVTTVTAATAVAVGGVVAPAIIAADLTPPPAAVAFAEFDVAVPSFDLDEDASETGALVIEGTGPYEVSVAGADGLATVDVGAPSSPSDNRTLVPITVISAPDASGSVPIVVTICHEGSCRDETTTLTINPVNDAPTTAFDPPTIRRGDTVVIQLVTAGEDPATVDRVPLVVSDVEGDVVAFGAIVSSANGTATITGDVLTFVHDGSALPRASMRVTLTDGTDTVERLLAFDVVNPNRPPDLAAGPASVLETAPVGTVVTTVLATDPNDDAISYALVGDPGPFALDSETGALIVAEPLDVPADRIVTLVVRATDIWGDSSRADLAVSIEDVNTPPNISNAPATASIDESAALGTALVTLAGSDGDGDSITWSINDPTGSFAIEPDGTIIVAGPLDHETQPTVPLVATVTDADGASSSTPITVTVLDSNEAPAIVAPFLSVFLPEDTAVGTDVTQVVATDPEGDGVSYAIATGGPEFSIDPSTGRVTLLSSLDHETTPTLSLTVRASDDASPAAASQRTIEFVIQDVNEPPVVTSPLVTTSEDTVVGAQAFALTATDPEGDPVSFSITSGNADGLFSLDPATGVARLVSPLDHETEPSRVLTVRADDGTSSSTATVTVTIDDVNEAPVITPGQTFYVDEAGLVGDAIGVVAISDPEGDPLLVSIASAIPTGFVVVDETTGELSIAAPLDHETVPSITVTVTAKDDVPDSLSSSVDVTIVVTDGTEPPIVDDQAFDIDENTSGPAPVGLVVATDPDVGDTLVFSIVAGDPAGFFSIDSSTGQLDTTAAATLDAETTSLYNLDVEVTDGLFVVPATMKVTINDIDEAPAITGPLGPIPIDETWGAAPVTTVTAVDPESDALTFALVGGNPGPTFAIDPTSGVISRIGPLDHETAPSFDLVVEATQVDDATLKDTATVTIDVTDIDEAPVITSSSVVDVAEGTSPGTLVGAVSATDPEGEALGYSIDSGPLAIDPSTGTLTLVAAIDHETAPSYTLVVTVTDTADPVALARTQTLLLNVLNVDEPPVVVPPTTTDLDENLPVGTVLGTASISDPESTPLLASIAGGPFALAPDGTITTTAVLDHEAAASYTLTITATEDVPVGAKTTVQSFAVAVNDLNEAPIIPAGQSFALAEDDGVATSAGTVNVTDPDVTPSYTFSILSGNPGNAFTINPTTGELTVATAGLLDHETTPTWTLDIQVIDGPHTITQTVDIDITDVPEPPSLTVDPNPNVDENTAPTTVITTASAIDPDVPSTLTFSLVGPNPGGFTINPTTGDIAVGAALDYESSPNHALTVRVTDGTFDVDQTITVDVNDVNEAPTIPAGQTFTLAEDDGIATSAGTVNVTDDDTGPSYTFSIIAGNADGAFTIAPTTGEMTVATAGLFDHETVPSRTLDIQLVDGPHTITQTVDVDITDVPEAPTLTVDPNPNVNEDAVGGFIFTDADATDPDVPSTLTFSVVGPNPAGFAIDNVTGELKVGPALDHETLDQVALTIRVSDGTFDVDQTITVDINDVNEAPIIAAGQAFDIVEDDPFGTPVELAGSPEAVAASDPDAGDSIVGWAITGGTGLGRFSIDAGGQITTNGALDFNAVPSYTLLVEATDTGGSTGSQTVTIAVESRFGAAPSPFAGQIVFNEIMYNEAGGFGFWQGWELVNTTGAPISIENWEIGDYEPGVLTEPDRANTTFGPVTLAPGEEVSFYVPVITPWHTIDDVWLFDDSGRLVAYMAWGDEGAAGSQITSQPPLDQWNLWDDTYQASLGGAAVGQSISRTPTGSASTNSGCWEPTTSNDAQAGGRCPGALPTIDSSDDRTDSLGAPNTLPAVPIELLISEFAYDGMYSFGDFVELYNPSATPIDLAGVEVHIADDAGVLETIPIAPVGPPDMLAPGEHVLVARQGSPLAAVADSTFSTAIGHEFGLGIWFGGQYVDQVGSRDADDGGGGENEGFLVEAPGLARVRADGAYEQSMERRKSLGLGNCTDTNNNSRDFLRNFAPGSVNPQNRVSPTEPCGGTLPSVPWSDAVISEFRSEGPDGGDDEFVEVFNPTNSPIDMTGYEIRDDANVLFTFPAVVLQPGQHFLAAGPDYVGTVDANYTGGTSLGAGETLGLFRPPVGPGPMVPTMLIPYDQGGATLPRLDDNYEATYRLRNNGCGDYGSDQLSFRWRSNARPNTTASSLTPCS